MAILDEVLEFLRGALEALHHGSLQTDGTALVWSVR